MICIKFPSQSYGINFPTSINELTPEILDAITEGVKLPKYYCIVALAFKTRVFDFCATLQSNKNDTIVNIVPILAKISSEDGDAANAKVGDRIMVTRSAIELGTQIKLPTHISTDYAKRYFMSDYNAVKSMILNAGKVDFDANLNKGLVISKSPEIILLEFKIIPVNAINGAIDINHNVFDPFYVSGESN